MQRTARLPSAYQEVKYIESTTGKEYIETGIYPLLADGLQTKIQFISGPADNYRPLGAYGGGGVAVDSYTGLRIWTSIAVAISPVNQLTDGDTHTIICLENGTWEYDGDIVSLNNMISEQSHVSLSLFRAHHTSGILGAGTSRMFDFQYFRNGAVICSLVPCYRKSDNEIGMYDLVSKQFYTNAGTGTFTKGADV